jgi:hypothetical protein
MLTHPPPLPRLVTACRASEPLSSIDLDGCEIETIADRWTVAPLSAPLAKGSCVESDLLDQVASATAQLHLALGRLAAIHAGLDGIEAAMVALATIRDCAVCNSVQIRNALSRLRALAEDQ